MEHSNHEWRCIFVLSKMVIFQPVMLVLEKLFTQKKMNWDSPGQATLVYFFSAPSPRLVTGGGCFGFGLSVKLTPENWMLGTWNLDQFGLPDCLLGGPPFAWPIFRGETVLVGGWTNPFQKYSSDWKSSPGRGENKQYLKPPPSVKLRWLLHVLFFSLRLRCPAFGSWS